ncbi:DUF3343 domain-containing protein [Clostridium aminobutyricum]|uniref:DUF3343 domain-containing protein n=1 Tax=Clostridium aminobutyricum TaxID=33953 RepID=A0A939D7X2_CLOAM|nr:DUF3343 domain-containing protein [Clostridium aminobutyricum]MBN7772715.1 DUF3343 domain-containing protein [Clostridium aminobutyricum]
MINEYLITFSSFYKAKYAQEKIVELGIRCTVKKAPPELVKSCAYAIYLRTNDITKLQGIFDGQILEPKGIFLIDMSSGTLQYKRITL